MVRTLTEAHGVVQAAVATAQERNVTISVVVGDTGGTLFALHRMAGASAVSTTVAHGKAAASAGCGRPSGIVAADSAVLQASIATLGARSGGSARRQTWGTRGGRGATAHQGACHADTPAAELDPDGTAVLEESVLPTTQPGSFSTTGLDIMRWERGTNSLLLRGVATCEDVRSTRRWAVDVNDQSMGVVEACAHATPASAAGADGAGRPAPGDRADTHAWLRLIGVARSRSGSGGNACSREEG
jgi:nicotinamidase-related amidase